MNSSDLMLNLASASNEDYTLFSEIRTVENVIDTDDSQHEDENQQATSDVHTETENQCPICKMNFLNLKRHIQYSHSAEEAITHHIQLATYNKTIPTNSETHQCGTCKKLFCSRSSLNRHCKTHTAEKFYECEHCGESFTRKNALILHKKIHVVERTYICEECCTIFHKKHQYVMHMRSHSEKTQYQCQVCQKVFAHKKRYTTHIRTHTR